MYLIGSLVLWFCRALRRRTRSVIDLTGWQFMPGSPEDPSASSAAPPAKAATAAAVAPAIEVAEVSAGPAPCVAAGRGSLAQGLWLQQLHGWK